MIRSSSRFRFIGGKPTPRSPGRPALALRDVALSLLVCGGIAAAGLAQAQDAPKPADTKPADTKPAVQAPGAPAAQPPAAPAAPAVPAPGTVTYSGLVDVYYGINFRAPYPAAKTLFPDGGHISIDNVGRSFDINDREPTFSLGEFNINRLEGKGIPFGITATLTVGDTARLVHATEPGGTGAWQTLQQVYVTKTYTLAKHDLTFDFGKFVTPFGNEVIESVNNDEYSRSFGFQLGIPFYHTGLRVNTNLSPSVSVYGALVNGWNDAADDNNAKSGIVQLTWKPNAKFQGILGYMGGQEGTGAYGFPTVQPQTGYIDTNLVEFLPSYQLTPSLKVALDAVYGQGAGSARTLGAESTTHRSGYWTSVAGYVRNQFTPKVAGAARIEQFEDIGGLRTGSSLHYTRLHSVTLTGEYQLFKGSLVTRLEYRHDHANQGFFLGRAGSATRDQDTLTLSGVVKF